MCFFEGLNGLPNSKVTFYSSAKLLTWNSFAAVKFLRASATGRNLCDSFRVTLLPVQLTQASQLPGLQVFFLFYRRSWGFEKLNDFLQPQKSM
jgi:hypothetical protein